MAVQGPCGHDFDLHGLLWRSMPVLAHDPGVHRRRHVTERRNLADFVQIFVQRRGMRLGADGVGVHSSLTVPLGTGGLLILRRTINHCAGNPRKSIRLWSTVSLVCNGITP